MFGEKLTFGGANPQTELFWWDGSFWILDGSSKLWCFEWNGILSVPQVWRRLSSHEERRTTHVSTLTTSTEKVRNWKDINSQPNGGNLRELFWLFSMHIWTLTCYISANVLQGVWIWEKCEKCKNGSWPCKNPAKQLKRKFFGWDGRNFWSENNFFSLGWRKKFDPAGRPRYIYIYICVCVCLCVFFF